MNQDIIKGKWTQLTGTLKQKWAKLTDDDLGQVDGHREYLVGKLQERYGLAKDKADEQVRDFERSL
jgi:uncharacterized protein YjbJ (UPF0337 family)